MKIPSRKTHATCPNCDGVGFLIEDPESLDDESQITSKKCTECDGKGKVEIYG